MLEQAEKLSIRLSTIKRFNKRLGFNNVKENKCMKTVNFIIGEHQTRL